MVKVISQRRNWRVICFFIYISLVNLCSNVYATEAVSLSDIKLWNANEVALKHQVVSGKDINLSFNINGNEKDYYSFGFYNVIGRKNMSNYNGIRVVVKSHTNQQLLLQFSMSDTKGNHLSYKNEYGTLRNESNGVVVTRTKNGYMNLNTDRSYSVFLPFDKESLNGNGIDLENISTFGFNFLGQGNSKGDITLSDIQFVSKSESKDYLGDLKSYISGDQYVYIPTYGEIQVPYKILGSNSFQFINSKSDGISITKEGVLTVSKVAKAQELNLKALSKNGITLEYNIQLIESWTNNTADAPQIQSVDSYKAQGFDYNLLNNKKVLNIIRISIIALGILFFSLYWRLRAKYRKLNRR